MRQFNVCMFVNECSALFVKRLWGLIKPPTSQLHDSELDRRNLYCTQTFFLHGYARQKTVESKCLEKLGHHAIMSFTLCKIPQTHCLYVRTCMLLALKRDNDQ